MRSGTQDRNWLGFTPITLAATPPTLIWAPSNEIIFLTPLIARSLASSAGVSPFGSTISRSGRAMPRSGDLAVVMVTGLPAPWPVTTLPPSTVAGADPPVRCHPARAMTRADPAITAPAQATKDRLLRRHGAPVRERRSRGSGLMTLLL